MPTVKFLIDEYSISMNGNKMYLNGTLVHTFENDYDSPHFNQQLFKELMYSIIFVRSLV